jgi:hypothetical protein
LCNKEKVYKSVFLRKREEVLTKGVIYVKKNASIIFTLVLVWVLILGSNVFGGGVLWVENITINTPNNTYIGINGPWTNPDGSHLQFSVSTVAPVDDNLIVEFFLNGTGVNTNDQLHPNGDPLDMNNNDSWNNQGVNISYWFNASKINATASYSNVSLNYTFTWDITRPLVDYTYSSGTNGSNVSSIVAYVNVTDWILANATYVLYGPDSKTFNRTENISFPTTYITTPISNYSTNFSSLVDGNYTYYMNVTDKCNNTNSSVMVQVYLDQSIPQIEFEPATSGRNINNSNITTSYFFMNVTLNESRFANITFVIMNATGIINSTTNYTNTSTSVNLTGYSEGNYTVNVTITDTANNINHTGQRFFTYDPNAPNVTITLSDATIVQMETTTITCSVRDNIDPSPLRAMYVKKPGEANYDVVISGTAYADTTTYGNYTVKCLSIDYMGNTHTEYSYFFVDWVTKDENNQGGGGGGSSGGAIAPIENEEEVEEEVTEEVVEEETVPEEMIESFEVATGEVYYFGLSDTEGNVDEHQVTVLEVNVEEGYVVLQIESDAIEVTLTLGESKEIDLDDDGVNDLKVTLNSISEDGKADVDMEVLSEEVTILGSAEMEEQQQKEKVRNYSLYLMIGGGVLLLLLVILILVKVFRKPQAVVLGSYKSKK